MLGHSSTSTQDALQRVEFFDVYNDTVFCQSKLGDTESRPKIVKIDTGADFTGALTEDGELFTWGWNGHGQLGLGTGGTEVFASESYPRLVRNLALEGHR